MTIQFANLPTTLRVPFVGVEFDPSRARQGPAVKAYRALIIGHRTSAGTVLEKVVRRITGSDQAATWFGKGSQLHHMAEAWFRQNQLDETYAMAFDEEAGTAAIWRMRFTGPSTAAGTLYTWIGGRRVKTAIASGQTAVQVAAAVVASVQADTTLPVVAAVGSTTTDAEFTYRHKGTSGNYLDVRVNFGADEDLPAGVTVVISNPTAGATDPDLAEIWPVVGEVQYDVFAIGFHDSSGRTALDTELEDRWGPLRQNDGTAFLGARGTHAALTTLGQGLNSKHLVSSARTTRRRLPGNGPRPLARSPRANCRRIRLARSRLSNCAASTAASRSIASRSRK